MKEITRWYSDNVLQEMQLVRWGHFGTPVLLFPTAGGDAEEIERFHLIRVLKPLLDAGRIKIYSVDSIAGNAWFSGTHSAQYCSKLQNCFDAFIYEEVTAAIYSLLVEMGGSISAEHGIGRVKRDYLPKYRNKGEIEMMRTLKKSLDPNNILNPGKVI